MKRSYPTPKRECNSFRLFGAVVPKKKDAGALQRPGVQLSPTQGSEPVKTPKSKGASAPARETTRVNLSLAADAYRRLFVTSVMSGRSAGDLVTELIEQHLRTWSMPANLAARSTKADRLAASDHGNLSAPEPVLSDAA